MLFFVYLGSAVNCRLASSLLPAEFGPPRPPKFPQKNTKPWEKSKALGKTQALGKLRGPWKNSGAFGKNPASPPITISAPRFTFPLAAGRDSFPDPAGRRKFPFPACLHFLTWVGDGLGAAIPGKPSLRAALPTIQRPPACRLKDRPEPFAEGALAGGGPFKREEPGRCPKPSREPRMGGCRAIEKQVPKIGPQTLSPRDCPRPERLNKCMFSNPAKFIGLHFFENGGNAFFFAAAGGQTPGPRGSHFLGGPEDFLDLWPGGERNRGPIRRPWNTAWPKLQKLTMSCVRAPTTCPLPRPPMKSRRATKSAETAKTNKGKSEKKKKGLMRGRVGSLIQAGRPPRFPFGCPPILSGSRFRDPKVESGRASSRVFPFLVPG